MEEEGPMILDEEIPVFIRCVKNDEESIRNYKLYGPANPLINDGRDDTEFMFCPYSYDGVCYMLTCDCRKNEEDIKKGEWYTGKCEYTDPDGYKCQTVFNSKTQAWRTPLSEGGFNGCFCKDHFRRCVPRPEDPDEYSPYHTLCDIMIMVRERYPIQEFHDLSEDSGIEFCSPDECM